MFHNNSSKQGMNLQLFFSSHRCILKEQKIGKQNCIMKVHAILKFPELNECLQNINASWFHNTGGLDNTQLILAGNLIVNRF